MTQADVIKEAVEQGEFSEGEYGAGKIFIWDTGSYDLLKFEKNRAY